MMQDTRVMGIFASEVLAVQDPDFVRQAQEYAEYGLKNVDKVNPKEHPMPEITPQNSGVDLSGRMIASQTYASSAISFANASSTEMFIRLLS